MAYSDGKPELISEARYESTDALLRRFVSTEKQFALANGNFGIVAGANPRRVSICFGVANGPAAEVTTLPASIVPSGIQFGIGILLVFNFQNFGNLPTQTWRAAGTATGSVLTVWEVFSIEG